IGRKRTYRERRAVATARAALEQPHADVGEIARMVQLSHRRFVELFSADVGMTPKRYARICRFQHSLASLATEHPWWQIALESGYYDQAHLCREWHELTGLTPGEVRRSRTVQVKDHHIALVRNVQDDPARRH